MEMGCGKTRVVLERCEELKTKRVLVFAPLSVLHVWEEQAPMWHKHAQVIILSGAKKQKLDALALPFGLRKPTYVVTNYESALSLGSELGAVRWDSIICDESTKIKNGNAKRTKGIIRLSKAVPHRFILSGTPITESPLDIFSQFLFLDGGETFGTSFWKFREKFFQSDRMGWKWTMRKEMEAQYKKMLYNKCIRVLKEDCQDLPPKVYEKAYVGMTDKQQKAYDSMRDELIVELDDGAVTADIILTKLTKLTQITSGFLYGEDGKVYELGSKKLEALGDLLEGILPQPVVIWCRYKRDVMAVESLLRSKFKFPCCKITGGSSQADRRKAVHDFHTSPHVFIGQIRAGGLGIDLTPASHVIYFSNEYSLEARLQSEDRCHRPGQTGERVLYIDLVVKKSIDEVVLRALRKKKSVSESLLDKQTLKGVL